jgi:hypothetical protein
MQALKIFRTDWTSIWKYFLPYRDPTLLQRQWRVATGVQRSYSKSDAVKEKRRLYEAKRRKLRALGPDSPVNHEQEVSVFRNSHDTHRIFECVCPLTVLSLSTIHNFL